MEHTVLRWSWECIQTQSRLPHSFEPYVVYIEKSVRVKHSFILFLRKPGAGEVGAGELKGDGVHLDIAVWEPEDSQGTDAHLWAGMHSRIAC